MTQTKQFELPNGLTLLLHPMPWLQSVSFSLYLPFGTADELDGQEGLAGLSLEASQRGAGQWSSRSVVETLDFLGVERSGATTTLHSSVCYSMLPSALPDALALIAAYLKTPHFLDSEFKECQLVALQELRGLEDDPASQVFTEFKRFRFPSPFHRSASGSKVGIQSCTIDSVREFWERCCVPQNAVLAIAGNFDSDETFACVEDLFLDWRGNRETIQPIGQLRSGSQHVAFESQQSNLVVGFQCHPYGHQDYYRSRGIAGILSNGMSSRLHLEVREKRGLVYSIAATCQTVAHFGNIVCHAGSTDENAQQTLDTIIQTIHSIGEGIAQEEIDRLKTHVHTALILEQESSAARSSRLASDYFYLKRIPTHDEIREEIFALTAESIQQHFHELDLNWAMTCIGPNALTLPE